MLCNEAVAKQILLMILHIRNDNLKNCKYISYKSSEKGEV